MINVLEKFQQGDFKARFNTKGNDELAPVSQAFNKMADLLNYNINELTRSEKERKDLIANISHDLRTPLSIARGYTETLFIKKKEGDVTKEEGDNYIEMILNKILQVENMVKHLFELSKMESAEFKASKEPFVLSEIVQETVNTFQLNASEKKVDLKCTQCQYHVWVNADIGMMERVIQNLVDNAVQNTLENGTINVAIEVANNDLIFHIGNTGNPLPADLMEWINTPEKNGINHAKRPGKPGLGLAIVKKILYLHNSSLNVLTQNNRNVFSFILPVYNHVGDTKSIKKFSCIL
jgi:signal transduction histidine kinase